MQQQHNNRKEKAPKKIHHGIPTREPTIGEVYAWILVGIGDKMQNVDILCRLIRRDYEFKIRDLYEQLEQARYTTYLVSKESSKIQKEFDEYKQKHPEEK